VSDVSGQNPEITFAELEHVTLNEKRIFRIGKQAGAWLIF